MRQGKNYYADKRRELYVNVDVKLSKEPAHCHLYYKGELVGCYLLEDETKNKIFKSVYENKFLSLFKKTEIRQQFDFISEIAADKLDRLIDRYQQDCFKHAHLGSEIKDEDTLMIEVAKKFVIENADALIEEQANL
ncbi:MAG: hypothetical protein J6Y08_00015 [Clostridiales bacterium]|nr:hypothetical protein [Clostridiales bacterium]